MQDSNKSIIERQSLYRFAPAFSVEIALAAGHYIHEKLMCMPSFSDNKMTHESFMRFFMILRVSLLAAEIESCSQDTIEILIHKLTFIDSNDRHVSLFLMHAESHFSADLHVAEGVFHFVSVAVSGWTALDRFYMLAADLIFFHEVP